jgi:hypothetical protein
MLLASNLAQLRLRVDTLSERMSRLEDRSLTPHTEAPAAKEQLVRVREALQQLDTRGLSFDVHERIRQIISEIVV